MKDTEEGKGERGTEGVVGRGRESPQAPVLRRRFLWWSFRGAACRMGFTSRAGQGGQCSGEGWRTGRAILCEGNERIELAKGSISAGFGWRRAESVSFPALSGWGYLSHPGLCHLLSPYCVSGALGDGPLRKNYHLILQRRKQTQGAYTDFSSSPH